MIEMKCEICGQGPMHGTTVYRTGEKGQGKNPHWRCQFHAKTPPPADVQEVVRALEGAQEKNNG